jgi:hypothetical protein
MSVPLNYRASHSAVYYTPERRIHIGRAVAGFVAAAVGAIVGGFIYAELQPNLTNLYLRIGELVVGAVAVGLLGMGPVRFGKVRLPVLAAFMGAAIALLAIYAMWVTWVHHVFAKTGLPVGYVPLVRRPLTLFRLIRFINAVGAWQWHGTQVNGFPLTVFWLGEFAVMLLAGVFMPLKAIANDDPVCRDCRSVCKLARPIARFAVDRQAELAASVEAYDFGALLTQPPPGNDVEPQLSVRLLACPRCGQTNVVTVNHLVWSADSHGNRKLRITPVVNQLLVPATEAETLKGVIKRIADQREQSSRGEAVPVPSAQDAAGEAQPPDERRAG